MALKTKQQLVPTKNRYQGRGTNARRYLTIHQTDNFNRGAGAQAHANLQSGGYKSASWHWQVDDKIAIQSYLESAIAWHAGDGASGPGNTESIAIEMCVNPDSNYDVAFDKAAQLAAQIMKRNGIPMSRLVQHNRWTGKNCPSVIRERGEWQTFRNKVQGYLGGTPASALAVDGHFGPASTRCLQSLLGTPVDGNFSGQSRHSKPNHVRMNTMRYGSGGSTAVKALQRKLGVTADGYFGPQTIKALQRRLGVAVDGYAGPDTVRAWQRKLNAGKVF